MHSHTFLFLFLFFFPGTPITINLADIVSVTKEERCEEGSVYNITKNAINNEWSYYDHVGGNGRWIDISTKLKRTDWWLRNDR